MAIRVFLCFSRDGHRCPPIRKTPCLVMLCFWFASAPAQQSNDISLDGLGSSRAILQSENGPVEKAKPSQLNLLLSQQYFSSSGQVATQRQDYTNVGLDLDLRSRNKEFDAAAHGLYQGTMQSEQEQYFGIPELFIGESQPSYAGVSVTIGRQKRSWSEFDQEFGMGIWQPELRWDYLNPVQEGLTGLFVDYTPTRTITATLFLSAVDIPDQGPNYQLQNGQFETQNRWFWAPQINLLFGRSQSQVSYAVDKPSLNDLIYQPSAGGMLRYQSRATPLWAQASWAYLPMNQFHYAYDCPQCVTPSGQVQASIHPSILKHRVATAEVGLKDDQQRGWISSTVDVPDTPTGPAQWVQSSAEQVVYVGAAYEHSFDLLQLPGTIKASYLKAFESGETPSNSLVEGSVGSSIDRVLYQELAALEWTWRVMEKKQSQLTWRFRYAYSIPEQGSWLSSSAVLQMKKWSWNLGVDIIGANIDPASPDAGLFSRYRANDRAMTGMGYVF